MTIELDITALAAGGDGVGRDAGGRVTFVPRAAPGDRVRVTVVRATKSFAHAELDEVVAPSPARVAPPCPHFGQGCGGCQWQHVARATQLEAKQAIVAGALRKLDGLALHPIADPCPPLGWRRRARFHVAGGKLGLYALGSRRVVPVAHCPQLEPRLDAALGQVAASSPPDGELAFALGHAGDVAVGVARPWRGAGRLVGRAAIRGVIAGDVTHGEPVIELEPGLWGGPWDFAQASRAGNAALIAATRAAAGRGPGRLLELYAGAGNLTRGLVEDGWDVTATDAAAPARPPSPAGIPSPHGAAVLASRRSSPSDPAQLPAPHLVGDVAGVLARLDGPFDAAVLDPPRTGAADALAGLVRLAPPRVVYVSCDPATLARDAARLVEAGYRATDAWPIDLMPQTAQVEVVLRLIRDPAR